MHLNETENGSVLSFFNSHQQDFKTHFGSNVVKKIMWRKSAI